MSDLDAALRWLARSSESKSPSIAREHSRLLLAELARCKQAIEKLQRECDEEHVLRRLYEEQIASADEALRKLAIVTAALADLFDYTKEMERLLRPLGHTHGVEMPPGAELGARVGRLLS